MSSWGDWNCSPWATADFRHITDALHPPNPIGGWASFSLRLAHAADAIKHCETTELVVEEECIRDGRNWIFWIGEQTSWLRLGLKHWTSNRCWRWFRSHTTKSIQGLSNVSARTSNSAEHGRVKRVHPFNARHRGLHYVPLRSDS